MNSREFYDLVVAIRYAQNEYFSARKSGDTQERCSELLTESKFLERVLDKEIKRVEEQIGRNGSTLRDLKAFLLTAYKFKNKYEQKDKKQ